MWIDALTKFKFSCFIFLFRSLPAPSFGLLHQFQWEKVFAKSNQRLSKLSWEQNIKIQNFNQQCVACSLAGFQHPWKTREWTQYCVFCDKLHFFSCCGNLNMAMGSCIITQNRFTVIVTCYVCWVFLELKLRKKKKKFHTKHRLVSVLPVKSGVAQKFAFNCALLFKYR